MNSYETEKNNTDESWTDFSNLKTDCTENIGINDFISTEDPLGIDISNQHIKTYPDNLKVDIASVHKRRKIFKCQICTSTYKKKQSLQSHISSIHEGKKLHYEKM